MELAHVIPARAIYAINATHGSPSRARDVAEVLLCRSAREAAASVPDTAAVTLSVFSKSPSQAKCNAGKRLNQTN